VRRTRRVVAGAFLAVVVAAIACDRSPRNLVLRQYSDSFAFEISSDPAPARAREATIYKVIVRDKESGQPVEGGEGRVFATSVVDQQANSWDGLAPGPELGSYYAHLKFIISGEWAVAIQFRRDSTHPLERSDWRQTVFPERTSK
jgi:hypothetical protein